VKLLHIRQPRQIASRRRGFLKQALLFAALHYVALLSLGGLIFLVSHIPPRAVNVDAMLAVLVAVENVLVAPRKFLLWLWPWETTPAALGSILTVLNSLVWGAGLAGLKTAWRRLIL
jgi:hypothetical protein